MRIPQFCCQHCFLVFVIAAITLTAGQPAWASPDDMGTVGIVFRQLFSETQPNHRGVLAVMHIEENSPAAKAGIRCSDFVTEVNGVPVQGRALADIITKEIRGPVGDEVRLTVVKYDGSQSTITMVRTPYPPHVNPAADPFLYTVPGNWAADSRYPFPLPWSPDLAYRGFEDLFFSPNFDQTDSPEYHSYLFFLWIEGTPAISASHLQSDMLVYFRGLAQQRGQNYAFTPDLSKISANYAEDAGPHVFGGVPARSFAGVVDIWDTHGKVIRLNSEVVSAVCPGTNHTALFFGMSLEPREGAMWKRLDAIRDTFQCKR